MAVKGNEAWVHDDKKERSTDTHNVDEPQKHHAEGKKPDAGHVSSDPGHAAGGRGGTSEDRLAFWGRDNILKWTVVTVTQRYMNVLKIKRVSYMVCELPLDKAVTKKKRNLKERGGAQAEPLESQPPVPVTRPPNQSPGFPQIGR